MTTDLDLIATAEVKEERRIVRNIGPIALVICLTAQALAGEASPPGETLAQRGYRLLTTKPYLTPDFDQQTFDELWQTWEEPLRSQAKAASLEERRRMAFSRYGLTLAPGSSGPVAMQYVDDGQGGWVMNCLACHGGKVAGKVIPGLPNSLFALETLTAEVRQTKLRLQKPFSRMDAGSLFVPLGTTNGTTNAVIFGVLLLAKRDADLNVRQDQPTPDMLHHDHDAPPWWHYKKKKNIYIDGFAPKGHRPLMQFLLVPQNGPEKFRQWEEDYRAIEAWIASLEAPKYPYEIDHKLANEGERVFKRTCAECHGTYGDTETYPERIVPIDEIGTDRARLDALSVEGRQRYDQSWFADYGQKDTIVDPGGYVAPPLDGIWSTAPYLHNGSVPTLWHLLHANERPIVWSRSEDGYDQTNVGLQIEAFDRLPAAVTTDAARHRYFDTRRFGKSATGHTFPESLDEAEKRAVLEYLKTL
jgi:mono/diheme cytochrome c family protein